MNGVDPSKLRILSGWLVYDLETHNCAGGTPESSYAHEPGCGYEGIVTVEELSKILEVHFAEQLAKYEADAAAAASNADAEAEASEAWAHDGGES